MRDLSMRLILVAALSLSLAACAPPPVATPVARQGRLPLSACGAVPSLRLNLTDAAQPTPRSDAMLTRLGVRCLASPPAAGAG